MKRFIRSTLMFLGAALLVFALTGCDGFLTAVDDWLSAPYGYVYDSSNSPISGASVSVYSGSSVAAGTLLQAAVTTSSTGYFTLTSKVSAKGGTYTVRVTATGYTFDDLVLSVPSTTYLFNIGTIKPSSSLYKISGKVVNVRTVDQTVSGALPTAGKVEVRKFGSTTAEYSADLASDGTYSVTGIASGKYFVTYKDTATTVEWTGIPVDVQVSGGDITGLGALVYKGVTSTSSILLVLTWTNTSYDIDSYSMVGTVGSATQVYYGSKTLNTGGNVVALERDVMTVSDTSYPAEATLVTSLASGTELRFYAKCYTSSGSVSGLDDGANSVQPAGIKLYAMCGGVHFGTWVAPLNSAEKIVGMVQITGNADSTMTIGTFGGNTIKAIEPFAGVGVAVSDLQ